MRKAQLRQVPLVRAGRILSVLRKKVICSLCVKVSYCFLVCWGGVAWV